MYHDDARQLVSFNFKTYVRPDSLDQMELPRLKVIHVPLLDPSSQPIVTNIWKP